MEIDRDITQQAVRDRLTSFPHLSATGQHRALSLVDALVAAVAEARGLTLLHYDADFELASEITAQPHEWIVPRGTAD